MTKPSNTRAEAKAGKFDHLASIATKAAENRAARESSDNKAKADAAAKLIIEAGRRRRGEV